jgi:dephospho-CoA kinase
MKHLPKLLIIGNARHGKDTVCDILKDEFGYNFRSSSDFCAEKFIYDELKDKYGYSTYEQCFEDRHNHRAEWYNMIHDYCRDDYARLGREIFAENEIYCGLRNKAEFHAMRNTRVFDYAVWVDRGDHLPAEDKSSMSLEIWMADYVIDNNGTLADLQRNTRELVTHLVADHRAAILNQTSLDQLRSYGTHF